MRRPLFAEIDRNNTQMQNDVVPSNIELNWIGKETTIQKPIKFTEQNQQIMRPTVKTDKNNFLIYM